MKKDINIFDNGHYLTSVEIDSEVKSLISVFEIEGVERCGSTLCVLLVADMEYGIVITKDIFDRINAALDQEDSCDG